MTAPPVGAALVVALVLPYALVLVLVADAAGADAEDEELDELDPQAAARSAVAAISAESDLRTGLATRLLLLV